MSYRIYLAARYGRRNELNGYATDLRDRGFEVTSRWLQGDKQRHGKDAADAVENKEGVSPVFGRLFAIDDYEDIARSDIMVAFTETPRTSSRGGRHVEFGIALALRKKIIVVGPRENIFYCLNTNVRHAIEWDDVSAILSHWGALPE